MLTWNHFDRDPRVSYYYFLRRSKQCTAREAYSRLKRMDAMVVGLSSPAGRVPLLRHLWTAIRQAWTAAGGSDSRVRTRVSRGGPALHS